MEARFSFCTQEEAIIRMNRWGSECRSFFFMINFDQTACWVSPLSEVPSDEILFLFPQLTNALGCQSVQSDHFIWESTPQSFETYLRSFEHVHHNLQSGNSFLANLTCSTPVNTNLTLYQVFQLAQARYKLWWKNHFTVCSPETFVRINDGFIYSYPMKGTIDALLPNAKEILLNDVKEAAEHATITDLIRNDLSQIATEVTVTRYRYLDKLQTNRGALWQMSSEIRGRLPGNYGKQLGELFFRLLPAGSITGAPKKKTVEIIRQAETYDRGFYTGVMGVFDGKSLDSAVMIRFLEQAEDGSMYFKSGGGITFMSNPEREYEEMKQKIYVPIY